MTLADIPEAKHTFNFSSNFNEVNAPAEKKEKEVALLPGEKQLAFIKKDKIKKRFQPF